MQTSLTISALLPLAVARAIAFTPGRRYVPPHEMKPIINIEENIGKTVGRRTAPNPLRVYADEIKNAEAWHRALGGVRVPRGVYRFHSHEEADAWLMKHLTRPRS